MPLAVDGRKVCSKCRVERPVAAYTPSKATTDRLQSWCKPCVAAKSLAAWQALTIEEQIDRDVRKYGITGADYLRLLEAQGGVCAACRQPEQRRLRNGRVFRLVVDHCHESGRVRGLLCHACNVGIARFRDDPLLLLRAADYLLLEGSSTDGFSTSGRNDRLDLESGRSG